MLEARLQELAANLLLDSAGSLAHAVLFRTALAILRFLQPCLLNVHSMAEVFEMLRVPALPAEQEELFNGDISTTVVSQLRNDHLKIVLEQAGETAGC